MTHTVDLAIITVIPEEYAAIVKRLRHVHPPRLSEATPNLYAWTCGEVMHRQSRRPFRVVVAMATDPGTISGVLVTEHTVKHWNPRYVLLVGIAGGFNLGMQIPERERIALGDVLLSEVIWGYEYGKVGKKFKPRLDKTFRADRGLLPNAIAFAETDKTWKRPRAIGIERPTGETDRLPHAVSGPVASGDKVVDDPTEKFFAQVIKAWPKLRGIEMEGAGAAAAIEISQAEGRPVGFLMIRGISDIPKTIQKSTAASLNLLVDQSERDRWKLFAANAAAAFTIAFISKRWPLAPLTQTSVEVSGVAIDKTPDNYRGTAADKTVSQENDQGSAVLFYQADLEMLENSKVLRSPKSHKLIANALRLEFRLLFLAIPLDSYLVIPPSYYLESQFCRELLQEHEILIEAGFVRLQVDYPDLKDYLDVKKERYAKARHIERFQLAYFSRKTYGIKTLPFRLMSKKRSVGQRTLNLWDEQLRERAAEIDFPSKILNEFRKRALQTEKSAILYENLTEHMEHVGLTPSDARALKIRDIMNSNYLRAYNENGVRVPTGSLIIWDGLTKSVPRSIYHLEIWERIFESLALIQFIMTYSGEQLLLTKMLPETHMFLEEIRASIEKGRRSDQITSRLLKLGLVEIIRRHFSSISRLTKSRTKR